MRSQAARRVAQQLRTRDHQSAEDSSHRSGEHPVRLRGVMRRERAGQVAHLYIRAYAICAEVLECLRYILGDMVVCGQPCSIAGSAAICPGSLVRIRRSASYGAAVTDVSWTPWTSCEMPLRLECR